MDDMDDIHNLSAGEFHIFSDVNGRPIDLCRTRAAREPVIVGNTTLRVGIVLCTHSAVEITPSTNSSRSEQSPAARTPMRFGRMGGTFGV